MEYEEDEVIEFPTSEIDWGEESSHSWGREEDHDHEPRGDQTDSEISFGDESDGEDFEPEPPDKPRWYKGGAISESDAGEVYEEDSQSGDKSSQIYHEDEPWQEEMQINYESGDLDVQTSSYHGGNPEYEESIYGEDSEQEEAEHEYTYGDQRNRQGYGGDGESDSQISLKEAETETEEEPIEEAWESDHHTDQEEAWREEEELDSCQEES